MNNGFLTAYFSGASKPSGFPFCTSRAPHIHLEFTTLQLWAPTLYFFLTFRKKIILNPSLKLNKLQQFCKNTNWLCAPCLCLLAFIFIWVNSVVFLLTQNNLWPLHSKGTYVYTQAPNQWEICLHKWTKVCFYFRFLMSLNKMYIYSTCGVLALYTVTCHF